MVSPTPILGSATQKVLAMAGRPAAEAEGAVIRAGDGLDLWLGQEGRADPRLRRPCSSDRWRQPRRLSSDRRWGEARGSEMTPPPGG